MRYSNLYINKTSIKIHTSLGTSKDLHSDMSKQSQIFYLPVHKPSTPR